MIDIVDEGSDGLFEILILPRTDAADVEITTARVKRDMHAGHRFGQGAKRVEVLLHHGLAVDDDSRDRNLLQIL